MTIIIIIIVLSVVIVISDTTIFLSCYVRKKNLWRKAVATSDMSQLTPHETQKDRRNDLEDSEMLKQQIKKETKVHPRG